MVVQNETIQAILGLCARDRGHDRMYELLERTIEAYHKNRYSWEELIRHAELQGVAPLLYKHLSAIDFTLPDGHQRILRSLYQRSRMANQIRNQVVTDILQSFYEQRIDVLLIKGIALSNDIYESPALRPMRDIDLLVGRQDLETACSILTEQGFAQDLKHDIPDDYYHLPPMYKSVKGLPVNIEIHHELLPPYPSYPVWSYDTFQNSSHTFRIDEVIATTLNLEDNLHYLYLHGLKAPLTYEPFRLIHVADLVSLTEIYLDEVDWDKVTSDFPGCFKILSRLHFITPWQEHVVDGLNLDINHAPRNPGIPYRGWPLLKIKDTPAAGLPLLIKETVIPAQWWLQIYYSEIDGLPYFKNRWFEHPRTIWRWIKTYVQAWVKQS